MRPKKTEEKKKKNSPNLPFKQTEQSQGVELKNTANREGKFRRKTERKSSTPLGRKTPHHHSPARFHLLGSINQTKIRYKEGEVEGVCSGQQEGANQNSHSSKLNIEERNEKKQHIKNRAVGPPLSTVERSYLPCCLSSFPHRSSHNLTNLHPTASRSSTSHRARRGPETSSLMKPSRTHIPSPHQQAKLRDSP